MDPYETVGLRPRKRRLLQRCTDFLSRIYFWMNPEAFTRRHSAYPQPDPQDQVMRIYPADKNVGTPVPGPRVVTITIYDHPLAVRRTAFDMKYDNRRLRHARARNSHRSYLRRMRHNR